MSEQTHDKAWVLEKVKKLLALGRNDGATEGERDNAMRMAHNLLAKYNLDMAEAEAHGATPSEPRGFVKAQFYGRPWARVAAAAVGRLFFCEYIYVPAEHAKDTTHYFFGKQSNATVAASMAEYVVTSIRREGQRRNRIEGSGRNEWLRSFSTGAAQAVHYRVLKMIAEASAKPAEPGMSLVLASVYTTEKQKNQLIVQEKFPKLGNGRSGKRDGSIEGHLAGRKYGETINLNRQIGGKKTTLIGNH